MASQSELRWWDQFAGVMATQWNLTPRMNQAVRTEYEQDYLDYLTVPGGRLLDVGCGTGVWSQGFARRGMEVDGIDFSASQLELAGELARVAGLPGMRFYQRDIVHGSWEGRWGQYDSIFINALLHHLSYDELDLVFEKVRVTLRPGGRVYLYEPLLSDPAYPARWAGFGMVDFGWRAAMFAFFRGGRALGLFDRPFREAMAAGYTGISPDEHAIEFSRLRRAWGDSLELVEVRPFHQYSIAYAMSVMLLPPAPRRVLEPLASAVYAADRWLFRHRMWESTGLRNRWMLCGVKLRRPEG
jgi:cyclopropane fatty-acyl-phospholipid synthase-like methyltransferase